MKAPAAPTPPDPVATAQAQGAMNRETAIAQQHLNMVNQRTPQGTLTYRRVGTWGDDKPQGSAPAPAPAQAMPGGTSLNGGVLGAAATRALTQSLPGMGGQGYASDGGVDNLARYEAVTELNPQEQALYEQQREFDRMTNQLGIDQTRRLTDHLGKPIDTASLPGWAQGVLPTDFSADRQRVEKAMFDRINPQLASDRDALENKLVNQGLTRGTEAFTKAMDERSRADNDARLAITERGLGEQQGMFGMAMQGAQFTNDTRGRALQEMLTLRNQPINEITALMGAQQMQQPQFQNTPQTQVAPTDYTGLVSNNFTAQTAAHNAALQRQGAMYGAIGGMAGTALGGWGSGGFKKFW